MSLYPETIGPVPATTAAVARAAFPRGNMYPAMRDLLLLWPVHAETNWQARRGQDFAATAFDIQWTAQQVLCPQGHQSTWWRARCDRTGHDIVAVGWSWKTGNVCPALAQWTQKQQGARTLKLHNAAEHVALQAARQRQSTDAFRTHYRH